MKCDNVLELYDRLRKRVLGQDGAIVVTADAIIRHASGICDPLAPIATLLYIGPTGVGKTELAKELARELFGSPQNMVRINMAEFNISGAVTRLIGSPPGYVDSEKGGQLTNALTKTPNAVVLLDEIDKAHEEVRKLFLQIFDEGQVTSAMGKVVDCKQAIFILTSNYQAWEILTLQDQGYGSDTILSQIEPKLMQALSPELYNRIDPVLFLGLSQETLRSLVCKLLAELDQRVMAKKGIHLDFEDSLVDYLQIAGYHPQLGARPLKRLIEKEITTLVAKTLLENTVKRGERLRLAYVDGKLVISKKS
jgi:ATP-dependent Clp protease ATP-binding subunit ClpB